MITHPINSHDGNDECNRMINTLVNHLDVLLVRYDDKVHVKPGTVKCKKLARQWGDGNLRSLEVVTPGLTYSWFSETKTIHVHPTALTDGLDVATTPNWSESLYTTLARQRFERVQYILQQQELVDIANEFGVQIMEALAEEMTQHPFKDVFRVDVDAPEQYRYKGNQGQSQPADVAAIPTFTEVLIALLSSEQLVIHTTDHGNTFSATFTVDAVKLNKHNEYVNIKDADLRYANSRKTQRRKPNF